MMLRQCPDCFIPRAHKERVCNVHGQSVRVKFTAGTIDILTFLGFYNCSLLLLKFYNLSTPLSKYPKLVVRLSVFFRLI